MKKYKESLRADGYLNDFHKMTSQASVKSVKSIKEHPLSLKEVKEQIARHRQTRMNVL